MSLLQETRRILKRHNIRPTKKLGQNFLVDESLLKEQVGYASINDEDIVLEVGAGIGNLTKFLLEKAKKVIVVEKDRRMIKILEDRFSGKENLEIILGDVLKVDLPDFDKTVSNIPYVISSPLTFRLLETRFKNGIIMYQKEFAQRMVAKPGTKEYSRLSVACHYYADIKLLRTVPETAFHPEPKVQSALVEIIPRNPPFNVDEKFFFNLLRGLFIHRKKTVKNALTHSFNMIFNQASFTKTEVLEMLPKAVLDGRVFTLKPDEIAEMSNTLERIE
ncbi:MAG: 16S rRNA (adenine(1518)-N(6)/adenine(1519)-N(6))-dimethyltransferase RsmA [Candidatus Hydrothermarchaeales archaeon]